eukprot:TRINITY_DN68188_c8_g3_i1.p1 TRINITY_DN68188_c8_g3~~TRINITY_DN68188_c8_g3_i1.p1  ORF type:complete len:543 (+),score=95.29 TRINITY_DN68188_c8_g3_i1:66-1694(+)
MAMIDGFRKTGMEVRQELATALLTVCNIVKTSLGPVGLDKMLVDELGDILVTNDGATIVSKLEVEHPAARILVDLAKLQDNEVGDGTTSVVILAAELAKRANQLIQNRIHATNVITGYRLAMREACKFINSKLAVQTSSLGPDALTNVARTSLCSKIVSADSDYFAKICVDALQSVRTVNDMGDYTYPVKAINILKQHGKSARDSVLVNGFALNCQRAAQGMPTRIQNAKIALLDFDLRVSKLKLGVQIVIENPKDLEALRKREVGITAERIKKIVDCGANVILTTKGIDDVSMKYLVQAGVLGVRRCKKDDLKRIAKATGGHLIVNMASTEQEGEETFEAANLGSAEEVSEERFADDECIIIKGGVKQTSSSVILRGANSFMLDEMERALNDALQAVKRTLESTSVVAGGGAVETALSIYLEDYAMTLGSREQLAVCEFSEALLTIPKQLSMNAALDAVDLVSKLRVHHSQTKEVAEYQHFGLDLFENTVKNNIEAGVLEPTMSKVKSLQFAAEAAISVLRIDDVVKFNEKPHEGEEAYPA